MNTNTERGIRSNLLASILLLGLFASWLPSFVLAIPTQISYQGTLKEKGTPVNGTRTMQFRIINQSGSQQYWSSGPVSVNVVNGLFSMPLNPTGVNWQSITPYIEVSINGQALSPVEPINASVYANISADVADGVITFQKMSPLVQEKLIPSGMIAMFDIQCPNGWTPYEQSKGRFILGSNVPGDLGGSQSHSHLLGSYGALNNVTPQESIGGSDPSGGGWLTKYSNGGTRQARGLKDETETISHMPPYLTLIFCKKN